MNSRVVLFIGGFVLISLILILPSLSSSVQPLLGSQNPNHVNTNINNGLHSIAKDDFEIVGQNHTSLSLNQGSIVRGSFSLFIVNPNPIRFFISDLGFNGTLLVPQGVSVSVTMNGGTFKLEDLTAVGVVVNSANPLIPTHNSTTLQINYLISVSSTTPKGTYQINILSVSFPTPQTYGNSKTYQVSLTVG